MKLFYEYNESIDEAYDGENGSEYETGHNVVKFDDAEKALEFYNKNISHWASWIVTNDEEFVKNYPNITELAVNE